MNKKIVIKRKYIDAFGKYAETTEEYTSNSKEFEKIFLDLKEIYKNQISKTIIPSNN